MEVIVKADSFIDKVENKEISPFFYLKKTNEYLSNPIHNEIGRELVIRALDKKYLFNDKEKLLLTLVRKSGLYPYIKKYFSNYDYETKLLIDIYKSTGESEFVFHTMQARVFNLILERKNVVLSAPTSMGKSAIIDSVLSTDEFDKVVIVVPTIALIDETRRRIQKKFSSKYQIIYHNSQEVNKDKVIFILTQERVNEREDLENIDLFVIDEFYKLTLSRDDTSRSIALNIAMSKLLINSKQFYLIGPYIDDIKGFDSLSKDFVFIPTEFNTVAVNVYYYNIKSRDKDAKLQKTLDILKEDSGQTIIYCMSQNSISELANNLIKSKGILESQRVLSGRLDMSIINWIDENYGENWIYSMALRRGIAIHHGTLPRALQQLSIDLFNSGKVSTLLCTSTIIEGVNTVAQSIIIYDNKRSKYLVDSFTHKNISGRAGRMNQHLVGNVHCLEEKPKDENSKKVVELPLGNVDDTSPLNLLAGIQEEHLTSLAKENITKYVAKSDVPLDLIKKHTSYSVETIEEAYQHLTELSFAELNSLTNPSVKNTLFIDTISSLIKKTEYYSLKNLGLHYEDNDDLKNRIIWYTIADNHSKYISDRLLYIYVNHDREHRSNLTDNELKICRNVFKYSIPRALSLYQDLVNYELALLKVAKEADFGYLIHIFENSHLPTNFTAIEEMGVPIETLDKVRLERLYDLDIDSLAIAFIKLSVIYNKFDHVDRYFIEKALKWN
ncbi:DEAD/DEAH box helicase [Vibrio kanaloae]|uniref:DEAD/DEAH box helicase n=1 Tax=Vibrio kanaloae TaxID=170673 RepID=UPI0010BF2893|nr:DEAD/DEAH box helicase [Vibrio kanaloae]TKF76108.1 DEAD/DEAH box helicase [Vibrio kanaloae]